MSLYKLLCSSRNKFLHRIAHKKMFELVFRFISRWIKWLYSQCLWFNFRVENAVFYEQTVYLATFKEVCPKCTCNNQIMIFMGNKHAFFSRRVYFSADSKFTYKAFLNSSLKKVLKHSLIFKSFALSALTLRACIYPFQHAAMVVFISIDNSMFDGKSNFNKKWFFFIISDNYRRASSSGTL